MSDRAMPMKDKISYAFMTNYLADDYPAVLISISQQTHSLIFEKLYYELRRYYAILTMI